MLILAGLIYYLSALIANGKKAAWFVLTSGLSLAVVPLVIFLLQQGYGVPNLIYILFLFTLFVLLPILFLIPAVLLVLDRKNYFVAVNNSKK